MKPGRELDALIAEKVMGWTFNHCFEQCSNKAFQRCNYCLETTTEMDPLDPKCLGYKPYSTDISAAWEVVEKFKWIRLMHGHSGYWSVLIRIYSGSSLLEKKEVIISEIDRCKTFPHAICLAALKAVEK